MRSCRGAPQNVPRGTLKSTLSNLTYLQEHFGLQFEAAHSFPGFSLAHCCNVLNLRLGLNSRVKSNQVPGWTPHFDITTIPDDVLFRESARRLRARQLRSPRAKVLRQCPKCGDPFGARELRKHLPQCVEAAVKGRRLNPSRVVRKVTSVEEQEAENYRYWQSIPVGDRLAAVCELTEAAYAIRELGQNANQGYERTHTRVQRTGR